jgi:hypothetical protein
MGTVKNPIQRRRRQTVKDGFGAVLPHQCPESHFMLSDAERAILNTALKSWDPPLRKSVSDAVWWPARAKGSVIDLALCNDFAV